MRNVIYPLAVSLDGYIEATDGTLDWGVVDDEVFQHYIEREALFGTHVYGRRLYEDMNAFWPTADENPEAPASIVAFARIWKAIPTVVFSRTLTQVAGNARLASGSLADEVKQLKAQDGLDIVVGGAELAAGCLALGLVDELRLYIQPIILGGGKPMFRPMPNRTKFQLVETRTFRAGAVMLRYLKAGERS